MKRIERVAEREAERNAPVRRDPVLALVAIGVGGALGPATGWLSAGVAAILLLLIWAPKQLARRAGEAGSGVARVVMLFFVALLPMGALTSCAMFMTDFFRGRAYQHDIGLHYVFLIGLVGFVLGMVGLTAWRTVRAAEPPASSLLRRRASSSDMPRDVAFAILVGLGAGVLVSVIVFVAMI